MCTDSLQSHQNPTEIDRALPSLQMVAKAYKPLQSIAEPYKIIETYGGLHIVLQNHTHISKPYIG